MLKNIFGKEFFTVFDFQSKYIGYVVDNKGFENDFYVQVFIPELFGYDYETFSAKVNTSIDKSFSLSHILTDIEVLGTKDQIHENLFINVRPLILNGHSYNRADFIKMHKPAIGGRVLVSFLNGSPLTPYYENKTLLTDEDTIVFNEDGTVDQSIDSTPSSIGNKNIIIGQPTIWQFI